MTEHRDHLYETARKVSYEWKIENFFSRACGNGMSLDSPKFLFYGTYFHISIFPNGEKENDAGWVSIFLNEESSEIWYVVDWTVRLKRSDGNLMIPNHFRSVVGPDAPGLQVLPENNTQPSNLHMLPRKTKRFGQPKFFERSKLTGAMKDVFMPGGTVTVVCNLEMYGFDSEIKVDESVVETEAQTSLTNDFKTLSKNFENFYLSRCQTDVVIDVRGKKFLAHRSILSAQSSVFRAMFECDFSEKKTGDVTIMDCDPESFGSFLLYLYNGRLDVVSSSNALGLYTTADKYNVRELKKECCKCLARVMSVDIVCDVLRIAALHEEQELLKSATDYFVKNASKILTTLKWQTFRMEHLNLADELFIEVADKALEVSVIKSLS